MKQLLGKRIVNVYCVESSSRQNILELQDDVEVLVIEARPLPIENDQLSDKLIKCGQMILLLTDGENEMLVQLIGHPSCELLLEVKPHLGDGRNCTRLLS